MGFPVRVRIETIPKGIASRPIGEVHWVNMSGDGREAHLKILIKQKHGYFYYLLCFRHVRN